MSLPYFTISVKKHILNTFSFNYYDDAKDLNQDIIHYTKLLCKNLIIGHVNY